MTCELKKIDPKPHVDGTTLITQGDKGETCKRYTAVYIPPNHAADSKQPAELVINSIGKDRIHGYVSEPKYKSGDLEAAAKPSSGNTFGGNSSQPRQRLQSPTN